MKNSKILKRAKALLPDREFVCYSIMAVKEAPKAKRVALIAWVESLLDGYSTYGSWLYNNHPSVYQTKSLKNGNTFVTPRLEWMDWMIQYWLDVEATQKKQGDWHVDRRNRAA